MPSSPSPSSHDGVGRSSSTFRYSPIDVFFGHLDGATLAMDTILSIDHQLLLTPFPLLILIYTRRAKPVVFYGGGGGGREGGREEEVFLGQVKKVVKLQLLLLRRRRRRT